MAKAKYKYSEIMSPTFDMPADYSDLEKVYHTLAKNADTRLRRLEKLSEQKGYKPVLQWSYARAMRDIESWSGPGKTTFDVKAPAGTANLRAKIEDIKTFLEAPTSTKGMITKMYRGKAKKLNDLYGTNFKWNEVGTFFESDLYKKMDKKMGSATALKVIGTIQKNKKKIIQSIEEANKRDIKVPDDMVGELTKSTLKEYGDEVLDFLTSSRK